MAVLPVVRIAAVSLSLLALGACDSSEERAAKHYQAGLALLEAGDVDRALVEFRNVFALDEGNTEARMAYAKATRSVGNITESYTNFLRIVERFPGNAEARLALTQLAIETQNWDEAKRHGEALVEANVEIDGAATAKLALEYREAALKEDEARLRELTTQAEALFQTRKDDVILQRILIEGYARQGDLDAALEVLDLALSQTPTNRQLYIVKAQILNGKGDAEAVEAHLRDTITRFPDDDSSKAALIRQLASSGRLDAAEDFLREDLARASSPETAHVSLISFLRQARGNDAAVEELDRAIAAYEENRVFRALKAGIIFDTGQAAEAVAIMQGVVDDSEPSEDTDRFKVTLARMLVATGNEVGARQLVEDVLAHDPAQPNALKMTARWQIDADEPEEALRSLRLVLDRAPEDAEAMTLMAEAHQRNGNPELAQDVLALAVEASGNAPRESLRFARNLIDQERFRPAEDVLIRALRRSPGNADLLLMLGQVYIATEDWVRADQVEATLRRIDTVRTNQIADEIQLQVYGRREGRDRAIAFLEDLTNTGDGNSAATVALIRARLAENKGEEALEMAKKLVEDFPENSGAQLVLGNTYFALQRYPEAEEVLRKTLEETGNSAAALQLVRVLGAQSRVDDARETLDNALEAAPNDANLLWAKASILERSNDIDGAIAIYERLYQNDSNSLVIANNLASLLATYREDDESLRRAETVARRLRGTEVPPFQDTYGWIQYREGNFEEALRYLEPAAEGLPNDPIVQFHLGKVYAAMGRPEDAAEAFRRSVEIAAPDDTRAQIVEAREFLAKN
jgi:pentatricopeptide repeat protein